MWFLEPSTQDDTCANRAEHTLDWLARSTSARAKECRRFLNEHISKMPEQNRNSFVRDLREKWQSTFFELITARILQELGASIVLEAANPDGKRPDFKAQFLDAPVIVEAKSPVFNSETGEELKQRIPLLNYIESKIPNGWLVSVWQVPKIGPADSRKQFERVVDQMLDIPPPYQDGTDRELIEEIGNGIIHLHLIPKSSNNNRLGWEAPISLVDNSRSRIIHAVKSKRKQVRNSQTPVLLAIQASSISSRFEDFDMALFGGECAHIGQNHRVIKTTFLPNGIFNNKSDRAPTYAGVLAFLNVDFNICVGPILYHHPRFSGTLPNEILRLEQRKYNEITNRIETVPSRFPDLSEMLNLVKV